MFGIELRRKNNIGNLFHDADTVLEKAGVLRDQVPASMQQAGIATSLQKMLSGSYFDICAVDSCRKVSGLVISSERYDFYRTQHCVHWSEMLPDFKQVLVAMILDDFREVLNPSKDVVKG